MIEKIPSQEALRVLLAELEGDDAIGHPESIRRRINAVDRIESLLRYVVDSELRRCALATCDRFAAQNHLIYQGIRDDIRCGRGTESLAGMVGQLSSGAHGLDSYDPLDDLVSAVLQIGEPQVSTVELTQDMVFYQPTPARHVLAMIRDCGLGETDVLVDLGSGLGHVVLLTAICTRANAIGIEVEPAYVACSQEVAASLNLVNVHFVCVDARISDLSKGTVFYIYTPFKGAILRDVLDRLRHEATRRVIRICTFGPCTPIVAMEPWLVRLDTSTAEGLAIFCSRISETIA